MATSSFDNTNLIIAPTYNKVFETYDDLRGFDVSGLNPADTVIVAGRGSVGDGYGGLFTWAPNKDLDDNNITVIRPSMITADDNGRWIVINYNAQGPIGDQGPTGNQGSAGDQGPDGDPGITGPDGSLGDLIGAIKIFAGSAAPTGWLLCNGSSISRETYTDLFAVIGTTYGSINGTVFNVPDLRGKFIYGADGTYVLGTAAGASTTTLVEGNLPKHAHFLFADNDQAYNNIQYSPTAATNRGAHGGSSGSSYNMGANQSGQPAVFGKTSDFGSDTPTPIDNLPPFMAMNYIIKY